MAKSQPNITQTELINLSFLDEDIFPFMLKIFLQSYFFRQIVTIYPEIHNTKSSFGSFLCYFGEEKKKCFFKLNLLK